MRTHIVDRLGGDAAAQCAADLDASSLTDDTAAKYEHHWAQFSRFCAETRRQALPASPDTVAAYLRSILLRGPVQLKSLQAYLSPLSTRHAVAGCPQPAVGPFLASLRAGYGRRWCDWARALPMERAMFPAVAAWSIAVAAAKTTCHIKRGRLTTIVAAFIFFRRTAELLRLRREDVRVLPDGTIEFQVTRYNAERRAGATRLTYTVPPALHDPNLPLALLRERLAWLAAAGAPPAQPIFSALGDPRPPTRATMAQWLIEACHDLGITAPVGAFFAPYSTRGGAATAAFSVGVPDGRIVALLGHNRQDTVTAHTHYVDALVHPCPAARRFFDRFLPRH